MGLVLGASEGRAHAQRTRGLEGSVDFWGVVGGTVVKQESERRRAGRVHAVREGIDDRRAVLCVAHREPGASIAVSVDSKLEVEVERFTAEHDADFLAIPDPLCAGEEGLEGAA
jgi:hypothetical protein